MPMIDTCDTVTNIDTLPPQSLEQLERQMIALLYAIWRVQGKSKRVVEVRKDGDNDRTVSSNIQ